MEKIKKLETLVAVDDGHSLRVNPYGVRELETKIDEIIDKLNELIEDKNEEEKQYKKSSEDLAEDYWNNALNLFNSLKGDKSNDKNRTKK